jgi:hypothetical protein
VEEEAEKHTGVKTRGKQATCFSETLIDFNGLRGVVSQKIVLFITAAVRT